MTTVVKMKSGAFPANGKEGAERLTHDGVTFRWNLVLSPDGNYIAHDDKHGNLWLLNLASGRKPQD